jgi:hypothetical protein
VELLSETHPTNTLPSLEGAKTPASSSRAVFKQLQTNLFKFTFPFSHKALCALHEFTLGLDPFQQTFMMMTSQKNFRRRKYAKEKFTSVNNSDFICHIGFFKLFNQFESRRKNKHKNRQL